ncbi:hypothetical protein ACQEVB_05675 [Pseudonocardia sp. CA-107938]|uniref:hypothetical protein n=1 Tax=Pseudonocardia sp. CA-107938 TaxID=3240021 RepID=UPI003D90188D
MRRPTRFAARAAVAAALALAVVGGTATPALAGQSGVITEPRGSYPTEGTCSEAGSQLQRQEHADRYFCSKVSSTRWDLFLQWYT